jgi:Histone methylation protein DOT1
LESPVKESIGVEFSKSRCDQANNARDQLIKAGYKKPNQKVEFWNTDMLKADIGRATVVFLNGVAHQEQFNRRVIDKLSEAPHPIRVISVVPLTQHPRMKEIKRLSLPMSWDEKGVETVIYETVPASHKAAG